MSYSVYEIKFPDGFVYVGVSRDVGKRLDSHRCSGHNTLMKYVNKYGDPKKFASVHSTWKTKEKAMFVEKSLQNEYIDKGLSLNDKGMFYGNSGVVNIIAKLNEDLKHKFKVACVENRETQQDAMNRVLRHYVDTNGNLTEKK